MSSHDLANPEARRTRVLVAGAGGFIGSHFVSYLKDRGYWVRGVDVKPPEFEATTADDFQIADLREWQQCCRAVDKIDEVYDFAADMGGIGYITRFHASVARNNVLINSNLLEASRSAGVQMFLFASSACAYPIYKQEDPDVLPLKEEDAYPADPEEGYGWEKLFSEKLCQYYREDYRLDTRIVRFHNVYGPRSQFEGGREKAPAALCAKVARARSGDAVEVWGDGNQTRSFMFIDDCLQGILRIARSGYTSPLNLGTDRLVTISELVDIIARVAGKTIKKNFTFSGPQGVRGRNSDNTRIRQLLGWAPSISLEIGLEKTYRWIETQIKAHKEIEEPVGVSTGSLEDL